MIAELLKTAFGFKSHSVRQLDGYDNKNYLVENEGQKFIFKTYPKAAIERSLLEAENDTLLFLRKKGFEAVPEPLPFSDGSFIKLFEVDGNLSWCRMLSFLEGSFMGDVTVNESMVASLGSFLAKLDRQLFDFDHIALRARQWEWDLQYLPLNKRHLAAIPDPQKRNLVRHFFQQYERQVLPLLPKLRKSVIHNDANEWNILMKNGYVSGLIDFGDLAHSPVINEVAIALTYICYDKEDPLTWAKPFLKAYHKTLPLSEEEIGSLYYLIAARLCTSVCNSAHAARVNPDNKYASVSEEKAWSLVYKWLRIGPKKAENCFREALSFPKKYGDTVKNAVAHRNKHLSKTLSISYQKPIVMERAAFQYMFDSQGNCFLDAYNNIPHVGHQHPKVVEAGQRQMGLLNTNTRYLYDLLPNYAERLLATFPEPLNKVFFVNSGSAASDLAIRLAKAHTETRNLMVMEHGYHGNTQIGIDISDYKFNNAKGQGQRSHIYKTTLPDTFRGPYTQNDGTAGKIYSEEAIENIKGLSEPLAAFISEPIVGCGGQIPLAKNYLKPVYEATRTQGGVCISDEVQTGFGRLGDVFWGFEQQGVVPDIVVLGKPMGNGHPIGAVVTTDKIAASFEKGVEFFSSFGGNPVSCAIGMAVLEVIEEEDLQQNALEVGNYYQQLLRALQNDHSCIGDVRGSGLFIGIDMVKEGTREPDTPLAQHLKNELRNRHILISTDGPADNVIKSKPPLCFSKENAEEVVGAMEQILTDFRQ
ncbi:aminotransferase class III-fold pyridoxal phosphate-dependent enzyme [Allomuricauda sp. SCSIO 65647]|uniref:aminotransferase class III-fold pyridoxal phosphate-dependent enzyme n=1 Tax=Allomuricauda sp. SCSIO 65647 TaxID=2908843 RepID=UPI001F26D7B0|nr:aminotransferase class III-fold pyridoxal phosphate-dependent enzyme [Muricauda sp. SCSIO 65647]UJH66095.1 aminotransferase class III-fold pyridoxal phosphate-dependent enzyme [Muricauda sp. SCSIO 65647]